MAYNRKSHGQHKGVSIVKRRGAFHLKWRVSSEQGDYRSSWERLPDDVTSREEARPFARRKSEEINANVRAMKGRAKSAKPRAKVSEAIEDYIEDWKAERKDRGPAFIKRNEKALEQTLKPFNAALGAKRCERLILDDLGNFRTRIGAGERQHRSANRLLDAARAVANYMREKHYIFFDPIDIGKELKHFKVTGKRPRVLDGDELRRLIRALSDHDAARFKASRKDRAAYYAKRKSATARNRYRPLTPFIVMGLLTGMRPGELEALTASDVREGHGNILVRASKTDSEREVPWHDSPLLRDLALALKLRAGGPDKPLIGRVKRTRVAALGLKAGLDIHKDDAGNEWSTFNRQCLRRTCVAHVAAGSTEGEGLLAFRFGHGMLVSIKHYRSALHGIKARGDTIEQWLGVEAELRELLVNLGYIKAAPAVAQPKLAKVGA